MTHSHRSRSHSIDSKNSLLVPVLVPVLALAVLSLLSACGGGSTPSPDYVETDQNRPDSITVDQLNAEQSGVDQPAMAVNGTIVIEERNGKTVFDAFFSHMVESASGSGPSQGVVNSEMCKMSAIRSDGTGNTAVELGAAHSEDGYTAVGAALTIESRVGQFEALIKQQVDDLTVYAPDARWQSDSLPEDAVLSFGADSIFDELDSLELLPLLPLVWLAPETGVMSNSAESLKWEPSLDEQAKIKLRLSAIDFSDSENPVVVSVTCDLIDDGLFSLPAEFQQALPDDKMGIVIYAVRERVKEVKVENTSLTIVQLSYPAPL